MRKFIIGVLIISLLSILYVFQHTKLLEYSYTINSNQRYISLLIDQNKQLRYNVARLETPARLEDVMLAKEETEVYSLKRWYKIRVREGKATLPSRRVVASASSFIRTAKVLLSMFSVDAEAIAKELNKQR